MSEAPQVLLLAWGNPGRRDDGLGPELAARVAALELPGLTVESGYQLQIEDADLVARYPLVLFADADRSGPEPFSCRRLRPAASGLSFSSHSVTPAALLSLARRLFGAEPEAWLLGIRGYEFDVFDESLSLRARENLAQALEFVTAAARRGSFEESPRLAAARLAEAGSQIDLEGAL